MNKSHKLFFLLALLMGPAEKLFPALWAQSIRPTAQKEVRLVGETGNTISLRPPSGANSYSLVYPVAVPLANQILSVSTVNGGIATLNWSTPTSGAGSGSSGQVVYWSGANTQAGSNEFFWDATNRRLGIGTSAPTEKFQVNETGNTSLFTSLIARGGNNLKAQLNFGVRNSAGNAVGGSIISDGSLNGGLVLQGNLNDQPSVKPHVVVNSAGELLVNTTSDAGAYQLQVNGDIYAPTARFYFVNSGGYTQDLNLRNDGTLTTAASDLRLKRDIATIAQPLEKVMALRGVTYNWKDTSLPKRMMGMIAQEVLSVVPELVFQNKADGFYGINYGETAGLLIEAIKEQQHLIGELKSDLLRQQQLIQATLQEVIQLKKQIAEIKRQH
ncbi:MAG: tail fiber domain-containing protein [Bacteroidota bacterium]